MKTALVFSGSFSSDSINHKLVSYTVDLAANTETKVIRLSEYQAPIYTKEDENENGIPEPIQALRKLFDEADGFIISSPEYNSSLPAGFKNTMDWLSRMEGSIFQEKPVLLMSASPGGRGGKSVLDHLSSVIPFWGAKLVGPFSLPKFYDNFTEKGLSSELDRELKKLVTDFEKTLLDS